MRFSSLAAGNRHLSSISVKAGTVLSNLEFLCVCVSSGSFLISCAGQYSAEHLTGTPGDLQSSLCSSLLWYYALEILLALVSQAPAPLWLSSLCLGLDILSREYTGATIGSPHLSALPWITVLHCRVANVFKAFVS